MRFPQNPYGYMLPAAAYGLAYGYPMAPQFPAYPHNALRGAFPRVSGDVEVVSGDYDVIGAEMIGADPDAMALLDGGALAGYDANSIGAEVIGVDDDVEVGAVRPAPRRVVRMPMPGFSQLAKAARLEKAMRAQPVIAEKPYTKSRNVPLGVDSQAEIASGNAIILSVVPNGPYRPDYLIIPDDVAPDFVIYSLSFGRINGLGGANEVPAATYLDTASDKLGKFDCGTVSPGVPIQIGVRNISGAARRFRARFQGVVLES